MALTESQIKERNQKIREEFADTEEEFNEIHERQIAELPDDYKSKLNSTAEAANKSFEENTKARAIAAAGEKYKQYREQKEKEQSNASSENEYFDQTAIQEETQETIIDLRESTDEQLSDTFLPANNAILFSTAGFVAGILFTLIVIKIKIAMNSNE